jgi:hypothetical protein
VDPKQSKTELDKIKKPNIKFKEMEGLNHFMTKMELIGKPMKFMMLIYPSKSIFWSG